MMGGKERLLPVLKETGKYPVSTLVFVETRYSRLNSYMVKVFLPPFKL